MKIKMEFANYTKDCGKHTQRYRELQNIITFDIENSNGYRRPDGIVEPVDYVKADSEDGYKGYEFQSLMYVWQCASEDTKDGDISVDFGRTWKDFDKFLKLLSYNVKIATACPSYCEGKHEWINDLAEAEATAKLIKVSNRGYKVMVPIWVHNFGHEFQHLRTLYNDKFKEVFAKSKRSPLKATVRVVDGVTIEFRDSYSLVLKSLDNWSKDEDLAVKKLHEPDGFYDPIRTPITPLTDEEYAYCRNDVESMVWGLRKYRDKFHTLNNIPMTQTGIIRNECKRDVAKKDMKWARQCSDISVNTPYEFYDTLVESFLGGYTHANASYVGRTLHNLRCFDFASKYPSVMVNKKFPVGDFKSINPASERTKNKLIRHFKCLAEERTWDVTDSYLFEVEFRNVWSKGQNTFWSVSKCAEIDDYVPDNGRVYACSRMVATMTDCHLATFIAAYDCEVTVRKIWEAPANYLSKKLVNEILSKYEYKTTLKGVDEGTRYAESKMWINSIYGVCVQRILNDEIKFERSTKGEPFDWDKVPATDDDYYEQIQKKQENWFEEFVTYQIGVWVTAWSQYDLWSLILKMDTAVVYCDTDSIKGFITDGLMHNIEEYNARNADESRRAAEYHGMDLAQWAPLDKKGNPHPIGRFEREEDAVEFKTLGAKRYAAKTPDGKVKVTVAGLPKRAGKEKIKDITTDFVDGQRWTAAESHKLASMYNDNQSPSVWIDRDGREYHSEDKFGVCLKPIPFDMCMTPEFRVFCLLMAGMREEDLGSEVVRCAEIMRKGHVKVDGRIVELV